MDPVVDQDEQDHQGITSQKQKNRSPPPAVGGSDQESACSHRASTTIASLFEDNFMCEVCETVVDKRLSTGEDSIDSRLCVLEPSLRVLPGLSVMIEDIQSRMENYEAAKDT